jgi:hypothetical protein
MTDQEKNDAVRTMVVRRGQLVGTSSIRVHYYVVDGKLFGIYPDDGDGWVLELGDYHAFCEVCRQRIKRLPWEE